MLSDSLATKRDFHFNRDVPYNEEAERGLIVTCFLDPSNIAKVTEMLSPSDFYNLKNRAIYEAMLKLYSDGKPIEPASIMEVIDRKVFKDIDPSEYLAEILESTVAFAPPESYAELIRKNSLKRELINLGMKISQLAYSEADVNQMLDTAEQMLLQISNQRFSKDFSPIGDLIDEIIRRTELLLNERRDIIGIPTSFVEIDKMTAGFQPGDLIIIAGRPGMGKTSFALNIALNVARTSNWPILIFSLEMSKEQLAQRMLSTLADVHLQNLRTGRLSSAELSRLVKSINKFKTMPIYIDDTSSLTVMEIRSKSRRLKAKEGKLGLIVIDYLQLISPVIPRESRNQELSEISRGLKSLAKELEVPVVALSQLSREVERRPDKRPMLSDLRESGAIEQEADLVMFLYREDYYFKDSKEPGITEVIIAKQRNGPTGTVKLKFLKEFTKFIDIR